jgi:phenylacetate-CoA ligase
MDELTVRVERRPDAMSADAEAAGRALQTLIKNAIGVSVGVDVLDPDGVERSMGKMRRIIDERPRQGP